MLTCLRKMLTCLGMLYNARVLAPILKTPKNRGNVVRRTTPIFSGIVDKSAL